MRGLAAATGQDALGHNHAVQVIGICLLTHQDHVFAPLCPGDGRCRVKHCLANCCPWRGPHPGRQGVNCSIDFKSGEHQSGQLFAADPTQGFIHVDQPFIDETHSELEGGLRGALAHSGLQHPQLATLDGELHITHVEVMALQGVHDLEQLVMGVLVDGLQGGQRQGIANPRDDVFALGIFQIVAIDALVAGCRVTGEGHARARASAQVAEDHRQHIHRSAKILGNLLLSAIEPGTVGVPRVEDRPDCQVELLTRVLRKISTGMDSDDRLVRRHQRLQRSHGELLILVHSLGQQLLPQSLGEVLRVNPQHGGAKHLQQPAIGVPSEARVCRHRRQALHGVIIETDVEDRLHHAGHGELRAGSDCKQQRVFGLTERLAHCGFTGGEVSADLLIETRGEVTSGEVLRARLGGQDEAWRHRKTQTNHLGKVGTLASEKILLIFVALGKIEDISGLVPSHCNHFPKCWTD